MNLKPLGDRLVIKVLEAEEKTASGIVLPDKAKEKPQEGEVMAVGSGKILETEPSLRWRLKWEIGCCIQNMPALKSRLKVKSISFSVRMMYWRW